MADAALAKDRQSMGSRYVEVFRSTAEQVPYTYIRNTYIRRCSVLKYLYTLDGGAGAVYLRSIKHKVHGAAQ